MRKYTYKLLRGQVQRVAALVAALTLLIGIAAPITVSAAQITSRKVTISSSSPASSNATTTYTFNFTVPTTGTVVKSFSADVCTNLTFSSCIPSGFVIGSAISQPTNLGDASGWTINTSTAGSLRFAKSGDVATPTGAQTAVFQNVQNPTTANQTFYIKITTYSDASWSVPVDTGIVAAATASQISLTGTMDESLTFCSGGSFTSTCSSPTSGALTFANHFSTSNVQEITSQFGAATNGVTGYNVTVAGTTLTCSLCSGTPVIAAMGTQSANGSATTSSVGTAQFGMNVVSNTVSGAQPSSTFGAAISHLSGSSLGAAGTNYGTAQNFRFFTGDTVATAAAASDFDTYTASYVVNVPAFQAAGVYTTTLTYICTANY